MKAFIFLPLLLAAGMAEAQTRSSLSLTVIPVGSGGATRSSSNFSTNQPNPDRVVLKQDYQQERVRKNRSTLAVEVRNLNHNPGTCEAEWFFFAARVGGGRTRVLNQGKQKIALKAGGTEKFEIESAEVETRTVRKLHLSSGGKEVVSGSKNHASANTSGKSLKGWLVRLKIDGAIVESRASSPTIETLAKNDPSLESVPR